MIFSMMVAMANNRVIGHQNKLPWHLPADMAFFKRNTTGKAVLMGRKTYDSIGKALPNRDNFILSRQLGLQIAGCHVVSSIEQAVSQTDDELVCMGGSQLYQQCLPLVERIYLTEIKATFSGDSFFPELPLNHWHRIQYEQHHADAKNRWDYSFSLWEKT